ncbi:VOC family protein [Curtobacterium sp. USHLN213]|uniref:VOC family protein n=1 Tax=Curtobacterium sp. USHLN213 TaxID=3081255 RepID=UPI0030191A3A
MTTYASPAVVLDVPDLAPSSAFIAEHLGFAPIASDATFAAFTHPSIDVRIIFTRSKASASGALTGVQIGLIVEDVDADWERLRDHAITASEPQTMASGERFVLLTDGNGVTYRLVQWVV